ncbi:hypothetical protein GNT15_24645 [Vibrio parahaemolyticus]|uniref:hypothetical protein n=1 Tax=Vibrio parahaemolyticus TaxID=670 RepID=UPI00084BC03F|nr:hypothetical protein [Vibrio parahaemolyticus]EGQ8609220.1 hypothetical protein [Vibrio parahaemolyticus]EHH1051706.1 hypothetical protein [Vibrio parahaemolyticus]MBE3893148.1 hypothetical protein [Vibrio parahaemolyticus]MBE3941555.1 hypothetical protein [Vibrio parahaemolyticus]MBM4873827.1 hypothetical protein [Vibrio parahaemolyticus]
MVSTKNFIEKAGFIVGILSLVVTIYAAWEQMRDSNPEFNISTIEKDKVTDLGDIPGLVASYSFNDKPIQNLWKMKVKIRNDGSNTVIGKGPKSNLISESLDFGFPKGYKIIDATESKDTVRANVDIHDERIFRIKFEQWRAEEFIDIEFFLEQVGKVESEPSIKLASRSLIDGEFSVFDYNVLEPYVYEPIVKFPYWLVAISDMLVGFIKFALFVLLIMIMTFAPYELYKYSKWNKANKSEFDNHIDDLCNSINDENYRTILLSYKEQPTKAEEWVWECFHGEKVEGLPLFQSSWTNSVWFCICLAFISASLVLILGK